RGTTRPRVRTNCNWQLQFEILMVSELTGADQQLPRVGVRITLTSPERRSPEPVSASQSRPLPEGGSVRPITRWGTPVMHKELQDVTVFDESLETLVKDMVATMY